MIRMEKNKKLYRESMRMNTDRRNRQGKPTLPLINTDDTDLKNSH
jgi:hypothetical protein